MFLVIVVALTASIRSVLALIDQPFVATLALPVERCSQFHHLALIFHLVAGYASFDRVTLLPNVLAVYVFMVASCARRAVFLPVVQVSKHHRGFYSFRFELIVVNLSVTFGTFGRSRPFLSAAVDMAIAAGMVKRLLERNDFIHVFI